MSPRAAFGPRLRAHRERHGITLESIAANTKIKLSLLAGLERSDVSKWPRGIFRRAYVRDYAAAIGLDPQPVVAEFIHLFPENGPAPDTLRAPEAESGTPAPAMRLTLAIEPRDHLSRATRRVGCALAEAAAVVLVGAVAGLLGGWSLLATAGIVALLYYPVASAWTGRTERLHELPVSLRRLSRVLVEHAHAARRKQLHLVPRGRIETDADDAVAEFTRKRRSAAS